ncbi:MAG: hypothetical protein ACTHMX_04010 [Thermomicrobiales bacterium]
MNIVNTAMLFFPTLPDREQLRTAAAEAYGLPASDVVVGVYRWDANPFPPGHRLYLNLWNGEEDEHYAGDLPFSYDQCVDDRMVDDLSSRIQRLAELLGMMVVTNDHEGDPAFIHLPDGTTVRRDLEELPEGGLLLPDDLKAIAAAERPARAA